MARDTRTIRVEDRLHKALRLRSVEEERPINDIIEEEMGDELPLDDIEKAERDLEKAFLG